MKTDDDTIELADIKIELVKRLTQLTFQAINQAKKNGVEADMLRAIRENILFLQSYLRW